MGEAGKKKIGGLGYLVLFVIIVAIGLIMSACSDNTSTPSNSEPSGTSSGPTETKNDNSIKEGMYKIGNDLPAGEYVIITDGDSAYFQISKDSSGQLESIICNDMFENRSIVTVKDGEYLELKMSKAYPIDKAPKIDTTGGVLPGGMYKVGPDHLAAGEYKVRAEGDGYIEVSNDSRHGINSIVSNDMFSGEKYVTVADGQYIKLHGAELVLK